MELATEVFSALLDKDVDFSALAKVDSVTHDGHSDSTTMSFMARGHATEPFLVIKVVCDLAAKTYSVAETIDIRKLSERKFVTLSALERAKKFITMNELTELEKLE